MKHLLTALLVACSFMPLVVAQQKAPMSTGKSDQMVPDYKKPAPKKGQVNPTAKPTKATAVTTNEHGKPTDVDQKTRGGHVVVKTDAAPKSTPAPKPKSGQVVTGGKATTANPKNIKPVGTTTKGGTPQNMNGTRGSDKMVPDLKKPTTPKPNKPAKPMTIQPLKNPNAIVKDGKAVVAHPTGGVKPSKGSDKMVPAYKGKEVSKAAPATVATPKSDSKK